MGSPLGESAYPALSQRERGFVSGHLWPAGLVVEDGSAARGEHDDRVQLLLDNAVPGRGAVRVCAQVIGQGRTYGFLRSGALGGSLVLVKFSHGSKL